MSNSLKMKVAAIVVVGSALTTVAVLYVVRNAPVARMDT
jgi:hypothetical protein